MLPPPGLGWSASDIVAAIKLIKQVIDGFREVKGAKAQYKESYLFLETLHDNLQLICTYYKKTAGDPQSDALDQQLELIKIACKRFTDFLERHLHLHPNSESKIKRAWHTVKWSIVHEEVEKLKMQVSETLISLQLWLQFEMSSKVDRFSERVDGNFERIEDRMKNNFDVIQARQKGWEDLLGGVASEWREDFKHGNQQTYSATRALDDKVQQQGQTLVDMLEQQNLLIQRFEGMMSTVEEDLRERRQQAADAETAAVNAKQEEKLQIQKRALLRIKNSSQLAVECVTTTVEGIKDTPDKSLAHVGPLITNLERSLKAIGISSIIRVMLRELTKFGKKVEHEGKVAGETVRDGAVLAHTDVRVKVDGFFKRRSASTSGTSPRASAELSGESADFGRTRSSPTPSLGHLSPASASVTEPPPLPDDVIMWLRPNPHQRVTVPRDLSPHSKTLTPRGSISSVPLAVRSPPPPGSRPKIRHSTSRQSESTRPRRPPPPPPTAPPRLQNAPVSPEATEPRLPVDNAELSNILNARRRDLEGIPREPRKSIDGAKNETNALPSSPEDDAQSKKLPPARVEKPAHLRAQSTGYLRTTRVQ